ncbi:MAG: sensor histidine kinase [Actinomycetia bacterium]|nr:sensor histidine kinase [Actinomycetes bacterium]MCP4961174.1 sensor histidine kinase [Actinomycetes bacterium]
MTTRQTVVVSSPSKAVSPQQAAPDWGDWRSVADWWLRPVVQRETWAHAGYLIAVMFVSSVWFAVTLIVLTVSLLLVIVAVGLPLMWFAFSWIDAMASVERRRVRWIGLVEIEPRPLQRAEGRMAHLRAMLGDPARWRQVAFLLSGFVLGMLFVLLAFVAWAVPANAVWNIFSGAGLATSATWLVFAPVMLGAAPRITVQLGRTYARVAHWFLGPDRVVAMQDRVNTLALQRQEILDAVASERRRIERNLHDGVQQRLVALGIDLGLAASKLPEDGHAAKVLVEEAREKTRTSIGELRVIGRGLHPAILEDRGLDAALSAVVSNAKVPITVSVPPDLLVPADLEETAYFVASEAISNIMKHSGARTASIQVHSDADRLIMSIHDDGHGGADVSKGSGLAGMAARVNGTDGRFDVSSPPGGPTTVTVELPYG